MVAYDYDSNIIYVKCLKSRKFSELLEAYRKVHKLIASRVFRSKLHFTDNEYVESFKNFMSMNNEKFQLVLLNIHRRNVAEQEIQTFKSHIIAG